MSKTLCVVVPCYNEELCLPETVPQFQAKLKELTEKGLASEDSKILFVNDGSKDRTLEICEDIRKQDPRLKVFSVKNSGPGVARNFGLKEAKGEYVSFADADDEMVMTGLKKLTAVAECRKYD